MAKSVKIEGDVKSQVLPEFLATYDNLTSTGYKPASWFSWNDQGKVAKHWTEACHATMCGDGDMDHLITAVPNSDEVSLAYQRMLLSGPFKAVADLISLERSGDKYFIQVSGLDHFPANVLFNYCIASRTPFEFREGARWEQYPFLDAWKKYVVLGYEPTLAFLLSYSIGGKTTARKRSFPVLGHFWFDVASDWKRIIDGDFIMDCGPYKTHCGKITPTNVIWGKAEDLNKGLVDKTKEEITELFGLPIIPPGPPPKPVLRHKTSKYFIPNTLHTFQAIYGHAAPPAPPQPMEAFHANMQIMQEAVDQMQQAQLNAQVNYAQPVDEQPQVEVHAPEWDDDLDLDDFAED